jgi:hypothetical protein
MLIKHWHSTCDDLIQESSDQGRSEVNKGMKYMFDLVSDVAKSVITNGISKLVLDEKEVTQTEQESGAESPSLDFESLIKKFLPGSDDSEVSEEELFAASIGERLYNLKGESTLKQYEEYIASNKIASTTASGHVQVEQAAIDSLKQLVAEGSLSAEEGDSIYSESFSAAQLDSDTTALFDGKGDNNDPSIAVAKISEAMVKLKAFMEGDDTTRANITGMSLSSASQTGFAGQTAASTFAALNSGAISDLGTVDPNGTYVDGSEGFLFKPVTNNEGRLAVLFAQSWTNNLASVRLLDQNGNLVEEGVRKPEGISETGREKFTFSKTGSSYPQNLSVEVLFKNGDMKMFNIPDPSKRYD